MPTSRPVEEKRGQVRMADTSEKAVTAREAVARGLVRMKASTLKLVEKGEIPKGDVLAVARVAGIMAAKHTPDIIPLCHPLLIDEVAVDFELQPSDSCIQVTTRARCTGRTGTEMEALTALAAAALTIYDMCKPVDPAIRIDNLRLVRKSGGKSGTVVLEET